MFLPIACAGKLREGLTGSRSNNCPSGARPATTMSPTLRINWACSSTRLANWRTSLSTATISTASR